MGFLPVSKELSLGEYLDIYKNLGTEYFLERRELGIINIGGSGYVIADGAKSIMNHKDGLYIGKGKKRVMFGSDDPLKPAKFLVVFPAS